MDRSNETGDELNAFVQDAQALKVDTDVESQQHTNREKLLARWDQEQAERTAAELGIELTDPHLQVVNALREHYRKNGQAEDGRELEEMLEIAFADQGGKPYLHKLFPEGPVNQGLQIANLPVPPHTVDAGFGTAR